jgi:hypothetical protein
VDKKIGSWTDSEIITKLGESIDGFVDGLDQKAQGIVPPRTLSQAWEKGYGTFANWVIGKTVEGGVGMVAPMAIARVGGLPAKLVARARPMPLLPLPRLRAWRRWACPSRS